MTTQKLVFWFEFASTYSHIAAQRIGDLASEAGIDVEWRALTLIPIFKRDGLTNSPFVLYADKGTYMWRDMARECARWRVPFQRPSQFPQQSLPAARVATVAQGERWLPDFVRAVYTANFEGDLNIGDTEILSAALARAGCPDPTGVLAQAATDEAKQTLWKNTEEAIGLGVFGAPTFAIGNEIFWGSDRMVQAVALASRADPDWVRERLGHTG